MIFDTSLARQNLLHTLYTQLLAQRIASAHSPRMSPPPFRMPTTANPFGYLNPTGAIPPHGAIFGADHGALSLVGQQSNNAGARNWLGPPPQASGSGMPTGPHSIGPAVQPPAGVPPLPR